MLKKAVLIVLAGVALLGADYTESAQHAEVAQKAAVAEQAKTAEVARGQLGVTLEQVAQLPSVKAHDFVPKSIKLAGSLYLVHGYFSVAAQGPVAKPRKVYADMFLSTDLSTAVYGKGYNTQTATEYTGTDMDSIRKATALTYGHGPMRLLLVTDPHCPYCMAFEKQMQKYADIATFDIIMIALPMHPQSPSSIRCVLSKPFDKRFDALSEIGEGKSPCGGKSFGNADFADQVSAMEEAAGELRVKGTPSLYTEDGQEFNPSELERLYQMQATKEKK